ncbi:MAG TPA: hypothetical protein VFG09_04635 [Thermodesulfovibrionales bacterium]|jgi:hypothetical protein|nr:hypothetical protein [Thermodesulfovibrionales bacterium]
MKEKPGLIEKELETLTQRIEGISAVRKELDELKLEIKGLKLFLGRVHPDFKSQFPEIMKKIKG